MAEGEGEEIARPPGSAACSGGAIALTASGALISSAFWAVAWLKALPGEPVFMIAMAVAAVGYVYASTRLTNGHAVSSRVLVLCLALALAWRLPLLQLPPAPARDAIRYNWDARVVRAGLNPYETRPDDDHVRGLHSEVTRELDATWLPTIYPPGAQTYFLLVTAFDESIAAFRIAALLCEVAVVAALTLILRTTGRPIAYVLLYAWHPLVPLEGASGAHVDLAGVLMLVSSWLALLRRRSMIAALTFAAAVLVKPLPLVLAPLYWRRIRLRDALVATVAATGLAAWLTRGELPLGSTGAFIDTFRFNGPLFAMLEQAIAPRLVAAAAVLAGVVAAVYLRATRELNAGDAWVWPMAVALIASPVIYPWYLVWLIPFAIGPRTLPIWLWTLSALATYPTWHLRRLGAPFTVPPALLLVEFALPAVVWAVITFKQRRERAMIHV